MTVALWYKTKGKGTFRSLVKIIPVSDVYLSILKTGIKIGEFQKYLEVGLITD